MLIKIALSKVHGQESIEFMVLLKFFKVFDFIECRVFRQWVSVIEEGGFNVKPRLTMGCLRNKVWIIVIRRVSGKVVRVVSL